MEKYLHGPVAPWPIIEVYCVWDCVLVVDSMHNTLTRLVLVLPDHASISPGDDVAQEVVVGAENGGVTGVDGGRLGGVSGGIVKEPIKHALEKLRTSLMAKT